MPLSAEFLSVTHILKDLILPPSGFLLLGLFGFLLSFKYSRLGRRLLSIGLVALYFSSLPITASVLSTSIQHYPALDAADLNQHQARAIVVLGGGIDYYAPEYASAYYGNNVGRRTMGRVRYAAWLARRTGLPVLVSAGTRDPDNEDGLSSGQMMAGVLSDEFALSNPVWIEDQSRTTRQNASFSSRILREKNIDTVFLVTHAAHMPRAVAAFQRNGINVIAAPTLFFSNKPKPLDLHSWLPLVSAMYVVRYVLHEWLGQLWYWLLDDT